MEEFSETAIALLLYYTASCLQKQLEEMEPRKETQIGAKLGRLGNQPGHRHLDQWLGPNLNQNLNHFLSYLCGLSMLEYR